MTHVVRRDSGPDLEFEGEVLGESSSRKDQRQTRWLEVAIYRTATGRRFIVEVVGRSTRKGDRDLCSGTVTDSGEEVIESLLRPDQRFPGQYRLPYTSRSAVKEAADQDERLYDAIKKFDAGELFASKVQVL